MVAIAFLSLALALVGGATASAEHNARHGASHVKPRTFGRRANDTAVEKREFDNARFTYYQTGTGACGQWNNPGDFIVAMNTPQYGNGENCFKTITITALGKTTQAQVMDECPGCPYGGLDMSEGLFTYFGSTDLGVITGSWDFGGAAAPSPTPTPTSTWVPPTTSTTPTTSSASTTSASSSTSSSAASSSVSASAGATDSPTASTTASAPDASSSQTTGATVGQGLNQVFAALLGLGGLTVAAGQAQGQ